MSKVYGIYGDNKCKREVIPVTAIHELTKIYTNNTSTKNTITFPYPEGLNVLNTVVIGIAIGVYVNNVMLWSYGQMLGSSPSALVTPRSDYIEVYVRPSDDSNGTYRTYGVKVLLMEKAENVVIEV